MLSSILLLLRRSIEITSLQPIGKSLDTLITFVSNCKQMAMDITEWWLYCQRVSDICAFDVIVSTRSQNFAAYLAACLTWPSYLL